MRKPTYPIQTQKTYALESELKPASEYNALLFQLYFTYLKRYQIRVGHFEQASRLKNLLEEKPWPVFTSWAQVIACSKRLKFNPLPRSQLGCPIRKIGYMLQELGAIPPFADEKSHWIDNTLNQFDSATQSIIREFVETLKQAGRADGTIHLYLLSLKHLRSWLTTQGYSLSLWQITQIQLHDHMNDFAKSHSKPGSRYKHLANLRNFFAWCLQQRKILSNPCASLRVPKPALHLTVCSEEQVKDLFRFIKTPKTDPQLALLIALTLVFGLTTRDLLLATLQIKEDRLEIILERKKLTYGQRHYNRPKILSLPTEPHWFLGLQKRFYQQWQNQYQQVRKTYSRTTLILPKHLYYNRPVSRAWILKNLQNATLQATGTKIPVAVLRKTCGHIHSQPGDASLLSTLGWSKRFAFDYTWIPRQYYTKN